LSPKLEVIIATVPTGQFVRVKLSFTGTLTSVAAFKEQDWLIAAGVPNFFRYFETQTGRFCCILKYSSHLNDAIYSNKTIYLV
jgi:hypothetical protein